MASATTVFSPEAPAMQRKEQQRLHVDTLKGRVVGFIDNAKPNFNHLVEDLAELLKKRHGVKEVIIRRKRAASIPAPQAYIDELTSSCDVVITGSGD